jgi:hypothetical protein
MLKLTSFCVAGVALAIMPVMAADFAPPRAPVPPPVAYAPPPVAYAPPPVAYYAPPPVILYSGPYWLYAVAPDWHGGWGWRHWW